MPSTVTTPVAARIPNAEVDVLRAYAGREGLTVSAWIARLIAAALPRQPH
jgi:hypothetical protein